jgi:polyisoprenoid-binding protein YceI
VEVRIQVASLDTKIQKRDNHLLSPEFFDAKQFPEITFRGARVTRSGTNSGAIAGSLTMHGVTRPLTLHVKLADSVAPGEVPKRTRWIVTTDPIRRKDFNLMFSGTAETVSGIGQEVVPAIEIEAVLE